MKLGVSQSHVQSDDAVNIHPSGAALSYFSNAASRRVPSRWSVWDLGAHLRMTPSRSSRRWQAVAWRRRAGAVAAGRGLAAFVLRFVLFFEEVVDVLVVQVVDVGSSSSWRRW